MKLRLLSRAYLGITALFYCFVGVAIASESLRLDGEFEPGILWACSFIFAGTLTGLAWFTLPYAAAKRSLAVCAVVSLGFGLLFLSKVAAGDLHYLLGAGVWIYFALSNFTVMKMPDPYILAVMEHETTKLRKRTASLQHGH